jgi:hypothetical protein
LKRSIEKLKSVEACRVALVSQLKESLQEQVFITFTCYLNVTYQLIHKLPLYGVFGQRGSIENL